jgi:Ca2+-binding RTX toxin-like protein
MAFLSDVGPQGTIHTLDLSAVTGNSFAGTGVTVEGGDAFSVGSLSFVGFSRIIGSAFKDTIDLSGATKNLIIDSGTGGADIATGSGNDIIRMQGEGDVDAGGGFNILDRSQLEGESTFAFSYAAGGWVASINGEATVRNVQHYKGSQGDNTFAISNANAPSEDLLVLEGNVGDDEFLIDLTHFFLPPALALIGGDGDDRFVVDSIFDINAGPVIINPGDGNDRIELNGTIFNSWFQPTFATISDIGRLADLDVATLRNPASGAGVVIIVNATLADRIWVNGVEETYDRTPTFDLDNFLLAAREFLDDSGLPEVQLPDEAAALQRLADIVFPDISPDYDPNAHLNPYLGGHPHPEPDIDPDLDPAMAAINFPDTYASLPGTDGDDVLVGSAANEHFDGGFGNDTIEAVAGDNIIDGGRGNDRMISGTGADTFVFRLAYGRNVIEDFNPTQDRIALDALLPVDLAFHDLGTASLLAANDGTYFWFAGMTGLTITDLTFVDMNGDPLLPAGAPIVIQGTAGDDMLIGSSAENNIIFGGAGNDFLYGVGGDNILDGGTGNDFMASGTGSDSFVFRLGDGANVIENFDVAQDRIALDGLAPSDLVLIDFGGGSQLRAGDGTEFWFIGMTGRAITDLAFVDMVGTPLVAAALPVSIQGTAGDDSLIGSSAENNIIFGGAGNDFLYGVGGDNILDGGTGNDFMASGTGSDSFVFRLGDGANVIENFDVTQDRIALDGLAAHDLFFADYGGGSLLSASDGTEFWFIGMTGINKSSLVFMNYDQVV